jgi:hypothetical protein
VPNGTVAGSWPAVVAGMRAHSRTLQALLNSAGVLREGDGEVVLGVKYEFHLGQLNDTRQRRLIEQVIHEVVGVSVKVSCVRATTDELRAIGKDDGEDDETFVRDVEERLRQFHARELGNGSV